MIYRRAYQPDDEKLRPVQRQEAVYARESLLRDAAYGAIAGFTATLAMTLAMRELHARLREPERYPLPPREIIDRLAPESDSGISTETRRRTASMATHFAYGALTGGIYGAFKPKGRLVPGSLYGVAVWAGSYLGWIPAAKILRPATTHPLSRNALMIGAHLVWGAATAWTVSALRDADAEVFADGSPRTMPRQGRGASAGSRSVPDAGPAA
jgi:hypothetical protein